MAAEWEMGMGMGMDIGFGTGAYASPIASNATPPAYLYGLPSTDTLRIDDLLDFSNHDLFPSSATVTESHVLPPPEPCSFSGGAPYLTRDADSSSSHHLQHYPHLNSFPDDLYVPSDEAAELEWLSKFVDDSFSDVPYSSSCDLVSPSVNTNIRADSSVPGRGARSKRTRGTHSGTAINNHDTAWSSLTPPPQSSSSTTSSSSSSEFPPAKQMAGTNNNNNNSSSASSSSNSNKGKKSAGVGVGVDGGVRRCTHCASEKTPQWRTGPLGPKTLCNACGVRYKSGRLVPEYRPAASPTFILTQHSNSHRKVLELRRQKELLLDNNQSPSAPVSASRPELIFHDYEVC